MKAASYCENEYTSGKEQINAIGINFCTCYGHFMLNISTSAVTIGLKSFYVKRHFNVQCKSPCCKQVVM